MISIVIPIRDEECNIPIIYEEILKAMENICSPFEVVYVNDHSHDNSVNVINELVKKDKRVKVYSIHENGKDLALMKGMENAIGEIIITIDGDLQNAPEDIPEMLKVLEGCDIVCGIRKVRNDRFIIIIASRIANFVRNILTFDSIKDAGCGIRIMKRSCIIHILECNRILFGCAHLFYPTILRKKGFKVVEVHVKHRKRIYGKSKFRLIRGRLLAGIRACFAVHCLFK